MTDLRSNLEEERKVLIEIYEHVFPSKKKPSVETNQSSPRDPPDDEEQNTEEIKRDITRKWTNWNTSEHISKWKGVIVNSEGYVISLNLSGRKLKRKYKLSNVLLHLM